MTIYLKIMEDISILELHGEFNYSAVPGFIDMVKTLVSQKKTKILLKLEHVEHIDNAGLGSLLATVGSLDLNRVSLKIYTLSMSVKRIFDMNNIQDFIEVYANEKMAIASFYKRSL